MTQKADNLLRDATSSTEIEVALKAGADINKMHDYKVPPSGVVRITKLMSCAERADESLDMIQTLLKHKADVNIVDEAEWAPIHYACTREAIRALLGANANINARTEDGSTALMLNCEFDLIDLVRVLIECGADLSIKDNSGKSAIDYANSKEVVAILIQAGASIQQTNNQMVRDYITEQALKLYK